MSEIIPDWTNNSVLHRGDAKIQLFDPDKKIRCFGCGRTVPQAHAVSPSERYCTIACFMRKKPMVLTGDTSRIYQVQFENQENRNTGRAGRKYKGGA
jgi:hypothetical protein